ncbi:MAG: hypothetical protein F6K00_11740 [Leptolyngbya sp. SIOISBB]|nr:hypothetical protein [Leptolyngbya sp. SIOISBB]
MSLLFAIYYGYLALQNAFSGPYVIQDDARQHVFWMLRFVEPGAFPNDFMADYYQANAPIGYTWLYRVAATLGLHPYTFSKILPPILGLLGTHYCFQLSLQVMPLPAAAFSSTLMLNQSLWMRDDLMSGTPRAFLYVFLLAFLVYVNRRAIVPCLIVLVLQPLIYPVSGLISAAILIVRLLRIQAGRLVLTSEPQDYWLSGLGLAILVTLLAPYALSSSPYGPTITPAVARTMPEFQPGGRSAYFINNPIKFWFGDRSGIIPTPIFTPPTMAFSLLFPWLWWRSHSPWIKLIRNRAAILQQMVVASFLLFFAAHITLYTLYLPSRYTHHTIRILFALTASFAIWIVLDNLLQFIAQQTSSQRAIWQKGIAGMLTGLITIGLIGYSEFLENFPGLFNSSRNGVGPELYTFFQETPPDTIIASLTKETSNLHAFTQRSPLISPELGLPYHTGYYEQFRTRVGDLIEAQYSDDLEAVQDFIRQYNIDFWLIDDQSFSSEALAENKWFNQHRPEAQTAITRVQHRPTSLVLEQAKSACTVLETTPTESAQAQISARDAQKFWLLDAGCLLTLIQND